MGQHTHSGWNKEIARDLAIDAAQLCGLDSTGMRLVHFGSNATFYVPHYEVTSVTFYTTASKSTKCHSCHLTNDTSIAYTKNSWCEPGVTMLQ